MAGVPATASQVSGPLVLVASQAAVPARRQVPTPEKQTPPRPAHWASSSVPPSQSLSKPSQTSVAEGPAVAEHSVAPAGLVALQTFTPRRRQMPCPALQTVPRSLQRAPSSTVPSQSLSRLSQTSVPAAPGVTEQTVGPASLEASQIFTPVRWQMPEPPWQMSPRSAQRAPSSIAPSQSSSMPLQLSACAVWLATQALAPATQAVRPCAQIPGVPVLQEMPPPGLPSSVAPSQSLSIPSQSSVESGSTWPTQLPKLPALQLCTPRRQMPTPAVADAPS